MTPHAVPVITLDGPSASGKGTIARLVSQALGFHYLDSGALYRLVALAAMQTDVDANDEQRLANIAQHLDASFRDSAVWLDGKNVCNEIRTESCGDFASKIAHFPALRTGLLERQRAFRRPPGLVADGRDMGSVVFPDAALKIYLTASTEERAQRRYKQLMEKGINANMQNLLLTLQERDERDSKRELSPLQQCSDAQFLDTTCLDIDQVVSKVLGMYAETERES